MDGWWLEAVGWIGSAVLVWSLLQTELHRLRIINLVGCLVLIVYNGVVGVWPMVGLNVVLAVINVVHLLRMRRERHDSGVYEVIEVAGDDEFLRHGLRVHEADIRRHNPVSSTTRSRATRATSSSRATRRSASCSCATSATGGRSCCSTT